MKISIFILCMSHHLLAFPKSRLFYTTFVPKRLLPFLLTFPFPF